jgi:hypothetical protein
MLMSTVNDLRPTVFQEHALALHEKGWAPFPLCRPIDKVRCHHRDACLKPGKLPLVRWKQFQRERPSLVQVREWRDTWPDANVAVIAGRASGLVVIDVDGMDALKQLEQRGTLPPTLLAHSGRVGGRHYYFRLPSVELRTRTGLLPNVDVLAEGGYVVVPPSLHSNGTEYRWVTDSPESLADLPEWLLALILDAQRHGDPQSKPTAQGRKYLGLNDGLLDEGCRNDTLTSLAGLLQRNGLEPPVIEAALHGVNDRRFMEPLPTEEVQTIARSVSKYPRPALSSTGEATVLPPAQTAAELLADDSVPVEFPSLPLLGRQGYIVEGWSHLLGGYPKAGKTELLSAFAQGSLSLGKSILWLTEEWQHIWKPRLTSWKCDEPDWVHRFRLQYANGWGFRRCADAASQVDADIVIFDTIRYLFRTDENDPSAIAEALSSCRTSLPERTLIFAHHLRKSEGAHGHAFSGSGAFAGGVDRTIELTRVDGRGMDRQRRLTVLSRLVNPPDLVYEMNEAGSLVALDSEARTALAVRQRILEVIKDFQPHDVKAIRELLGDDAPSDPQLRKVLDQLVQDGLFASSPPLDQRKKGVVVTYSALLNA